MRRCEQADQAIRAASATAIAATDRHGGGPGPTGQDDLARRPCVGRSLARRPSTTPRGGWPRTCARSRASSGSAPSSLAELERSGPRPLRTMWRIAREQLDDQYGQLTIGELLESYGPDRTTELTERVR